MNASKRQASSNARWLFAIPSALFLVWLTLSATNARAAEDCADTTQTLVQYLDKAETQNSPYKIKVVNGSYTLPGSKSEWVFSAPTTIEGGYTTCASRGVVAAQSTVIDASNLPRLNLWVTKGLLSIDGLTFLGGHSTWIATEDLGAPVGPITVTRTRFTQTTPDFQVVNGKLFLENVLADHAPPDQFDCAFGVSLVGDNTMQWNFVTIDSNNGDDICLETSSDAHHNSAGIYNSIIWSSDGTPANIQMLADSWSNGDVFSVNVYNSILKGTDVQSGTFAEHDSIHVDPVWVNPAGGVYTLQVPPSPPSPAINAGAPAAQVPGGISATDTDIAGNPRVVGSAPDMGAYESAVDDSDIFGVTTTVDCSTPLGQPSCGSLRDAIARANAPTSTAPVKTIKFWIIDPQNFNQPICPAVIALNSPLPDITTAITIDGYSQGSSDQIMPPLSWPNTDPYAFNAKLCVAIEGGPGASHALRVPSGSNGSLAMRGIGLGGFVQGVMLLGGANHQITGNQFGGVTSTRVNLYGFTTAALNVSPAVQPSGALLVGGTNLADRNVFLNASSFGGIAANAIVMGPNAVSDPADCQIIGNLVGIAPDGATAPGNDYGMVLDGDGCTVTNNWIAGSKKDALWVQGQNYVLQSNVLGLAPYSLAPQNNGGAGIRVNGSNNIVGASALYVVPPTPLENGIGNFIYDMLGNGIVVIAPGAGNTLRGNEVHSSGALAIDLGGDGPTNNDAGDVDVGANNLQNFPQPTGLLWDAPPQPGATNGAMLTAMLTAQPALYNVDVYLAEGCDINGRGSPQMWINRYSVSVAPNTSTTLFTIPVGIPDYYDPAGAMLSLTATNESDQNTSELGPCMSIDTIFRNAFEM